MQRFRIIIIGLAVVFLLLLGAAGLAFNPQLQTWAAHRLLARRPALGASVESVSAGLNDVTLRNVRIERRGAVLTLPEVDADLAVLPAGFRHTVLVRRLVAKGWTLDLSRFHGASLESAAVALPIAVFQGVLSQLQLPVDFSLDGLDAEGEVIVPAAPGRSGGRAHVMINGGGLAAGREGRFVFDVRFVPTAADAPVNSLVGDGALLAAMDGPRSFRRLALRLDAAATGPKLPRTMRLSAEIGAARDRAGETYSVALAGENKQLVSLQASFPDGRRRLAGAWKLDVCDDDLTPFMFGRPLPAFDGVGDGRFDADVTLDDVHLSGGLNLTADRLGVLRTQLSDVGAVRLTAAFDLTRREDTVRVDRLQAVLAGTSPILTVTGLQPFGFNARTGELTVANAARDLFSVVLQNLPLEWGQPLLRGIVLTGGTLSGSFVAGARAGGLSLRSTAPLAIANLSVMRGGRSLLQNAGMSLVSSADYTPQGWQVEVSNRGAAPQAYHLEARLGRLASPSQPVKLTGRLSVDLAAALARPPLRGEPGSGGDGRPAVLGGSLVCDFAASLATKRSIDLKLTVSDLAVGLRNQPLIVDSAAEGADGGGLSPPVEKLPGITANVRADIDPAGRIMVEAPLLISQDGRQSDLTLAGTATWDPAGVDIDGRITGEKLFANDTRILAAAFASVPFWGRLTGRVALALKEVEAPQFSAADVTGTLVFAPGALEFVGLHASIGDTGDAKISGACVFDGAAGEPYSLHADLAVGNFDPAPIFRARYPGRMPTVEGKFNVTGQVSGRGMNPYAAALHAHGDLHFASNGGVLRILSTDLSSRGGSAHRVAIIGTFIGDLASAVTGRKDLGQAIAQVAGRISTIPFDQMSFVLTRDPSLDTTLKDFALISPEMRLEGGGQLTYEAGVPLLEQPLAAEFKLGARGHTGDLIKTVGMLGTHADDLGYFAFLEPIKIAGTLGQPDTSELQAALLKDVYNRSGASDLFDKLLGK